MRFVCSKLSPAGEKGQLSVFIFHRVFPEPDLLFPDEPDAQCFNQILGWIKSWFNVLPLDQAISKLKCESLPERAAAISFDDGYADNRTVALPILLRHRLTATFFIATGFLDGGRMWNDSIIESVRACREPILDLQPVALGAYPVGTCQEKREAIAAIIAKVKYRAIRERIEVTSRIATLANVSLPTDLMMSSRQVKEMLEAGMQIGAHTVSHPILASIDLAEARDEMSGSKIFLENLLAERVSLFAYPNGKPGIDYLSEHVSLAQEIGFDAAVTTAMGSARSGVDLYQVPRFTPWDRSELRFGVRLLSNLRNNS
ncbi:MAG: polysaccharide deacetylase family protein [Propionivibrio sp.]|nr:polysaccharide deacetylase family protein [Propionivibrio sp.]